MKPLVLFFILASTVVAEALPPLFTEEQWQSIIGASPEQVRQFERERNYLAEKSIRDACASVRRITIYNLTNAIPASIVSQYPPDVLSSNLQEIAISAKLSEEETAQMYRSLHLTPPAQEEGENAGEEVND